MRQLLIILAFMTTVLNSFSQDTDPFQGAYQNEQYGIGLWLKKADIGYTGQFLYRDKIYKLNAIRVANTLAGEYIYGDSKVAFALTRNNEAYILTSEGVELPMQLKSRTETSYTTNTPQAKSSGEKNNVDNTGNGRVQKDPNGQFTFTIPTGWSIQEQEGNYFLSNPTYPIQIIVSRHFEQNIDQSVASIKDINDNASATFVKMESKKIKPSIAYTRGEGTVQQQPFLIEIISAFSPYGGGLSFITSYGSNPYNATYLDIMTALAESAQFNKSNVTGAAMQWENRILGKKLLYLFTDSYGSQRIDIDLYSNHSFNFVNNSGMMSSGGVGTGTYAGEDRFSGSWRIENSGNSIMLILSGTNGAIKQFSLAQGATATQVLLNNKRYFIQELQ